MIVIQLLALCTINVKIQHLFFVTNFNSSIYGNNRWKMKVLHIIEGLSATTIDKSTFFL